MNQFPYLYPHSLSEAERLNEEELWQDNRDAEVSHTQLTEMFRHSDPAALMDEAEQAQLAELDDTVTVYRGVTTINSDNLLALSWTLDYETADWFARRFDEDGTVYKAQIDKEHIFALFNGRDEGLLLNIGRQRGKETAQCLRRGGRICPMLAGAAIVADLLSADDDLITLGSKAEEIIGAEAQKYTKRIRNRSVAALAENAINLSHKWSSLQNSFGKADSVFLAEQRTAIAGGGH
jgi:hypothetical protein